jgi:hypothetical protein
MFSVIVGLGVYSLPNRTLSQITREKQAWPETEDMREVIQYWMEHRNNDPTYIYYGAAPAFRYYLQLYGLDVYSLSPRWYAACWVRRELLPQWGWRFLWYLVQASKSTRQSGSH